MEVTLFRVDPHADNGPPSWVDRDDHVPAYRVSLRPDSPVAEPAHNLHRRSEGQSTVLAFRTCESQGIGLREHDSVAEQGFAAHVRRPADDTALESQFTGVNASQRRKGVESCATHLRMFEGNTRRHFG